MAVEQSKFLLTEGKDDRYAIAGLMGHHVPWGSCEAEWPVKIECAGSDSELLNKVYLRGQFKRSGLDAIGIIVDANDSVDDRWRSLQNVCTELFPDFPSSPVRKGLVVAHEDLFRLGVWVMPDNESRGMLETFLAYLVPTASSDLWRYAETATAEAHNRGASYRDPHEDKAKIHTWLAWQDPPGRPFGEALKSKCLDPASPAAIPFVEWFIRLFQLESVRIS